MKRDIIIFFIIAIAAGWWYASRPAVGKVAKVTNKITPVITEASKKFEGNGLTLIYDSRFREENIETAESAVIDNVHLIGKAGVSTEIVVTLRKESGPLAETSGVKLRQIRTEDYREENISIGDSDGMLFTKTDGSEFTAFFLKNNKMLSVAVSRGTKDDLLILAKTIRW